MEDFLGLSVMVVTILLIVRWRGRGVLAAIPFGWGAIHLINISFRHDEWEDIEFTQDWPFAGLIIMPLWSFLVYGVVVFCAWIIKRWRRQHA